MKVLKKSSGVVTSHEAYKVILEELLKLPTKEAQLSQPQLRRRFSHVAALQYMEFHCTTPTKDDLQQLSPEEVKMLETIGLGKSRHGNRVSKMMLEILLETLHSRYALSQAELLQISDLAPLQLVEFYAIIDHCASRFDENQVAELADECQKLFIEPSINMLDNEIAEVDGITKDI